MFAVPTETPVITPPATVATPIALLDQLPPPVASDNVVEVSPRHKLEVPVIADGNGLTVKGNVT